MAHDGEGGLFGVELEALADRHADPAPLQQVDDLGVVLEVRAGRVPERVAASAVLLAEETLQGRPVFVGEAPLLADPAVPKLRERLGHLDRQAVESDVVEVSVCFEQLSRALRRERSHRRELEGDVVLLAGRDRAEEVGDAEVGLFPLARQGETHPLLGPAVILVDHEVVAVAVGREVPPRDRRHQDSFGLCLIEASA